MHVLGICNWAEDTGQSQDTLERSRLSAGLERSRYSQKSWKKWTERWRNNSLLRVLPLQAKLIKAEIIRWRFDNEMRIISRNRLFGGKWVICCVATSKIRCEPG